MKEPRFEWNPEEKVALCYITDKDNHIFIGKALCHEDDEDMMSERTGCEIAFKRAKIEYYRSIRDTELRPALKALKQLYYSMNKSTKFNPNSYENRMLQRQIHSLEFDLTTIKEIIEYERKNLKDYIEGKEKVYKRIRAKQEGQK